MWSMKLSDHNPCNYLIIVELIHDTVVSCLNALCVLVRVEVTCCSTRTQSVGVFLLFLESSNSFLRKIPPLASQHIIKYFLTYAVSPVSLLLL